MEYQQHIASAGLGVVVVIARSNRVEDVIPLAPQIVQALANLRPGAIVRVGIDRTGQRRPHGQG